MKTNLHELLENIYLEYNLPKNTIPNFFEFCYKFFTIWNLYLEKYSEDEIKVDFKKIIFNIFYKKDKEKNKRLALQKKVLKYMIVFLRFTNSLLENNNEKISDKKTKNISPYKDANTTLSVLKLHLENNKKISEDNIKRFNFFENNFSYEEIFEVVRFNLKYLPKNNNYLDKIIEDLKKLKQLDN